MAKLCVEMVPQSSWGDNLRSRLEQKEWDRVRKAEYRRAGYHCEICGGSGLRQGFHWPVECHETWIYDDDQHLQTLKGLVVLCPNCHQTKHFGRSEIMGLRQQALLHLMDVNGWDNVQAEEHVAEAKITWAERSKHKWKLNLDWLAQNYGLVLE